MAREVIITGDSNAYQKIPRRLSSEELEIATRLFDAGFNQSTLGSGENPEQLTAQEILSQLEVEPSNSNTSFLVQSLLATVVGQQTLAVILPQILSELKKNRSVAVAKVTITSWSRSTTSVTSGLEGRPRLYKLGWIQWFENEASDYPSDSCFVYFEKQLVFSPHPLLRYPRFAPALGVVGEVEILIP